MCVCVCVSIPRNFRHLSLSFLEKSARELLVIAIWWSRPSFLGVISGQSLNTSFLKTFRCSEPIVIARWLNARRNWTCKRTGNISKYSTGFLLISYIRRWRDNEKICLCVCFSLFLFFFPSSWESCMRRRNRKFTRVQVSRLKIAPFKISINLYANIDIIL